MLLDQRGPRVEVVQVRALRSEYYKLHSLSSYLSLLSISLTFPFCVVASKVSISNIKGVLSSVQWLNPLSKLLDYQRLGCTVFILLVSISQFTYTT